MLCERFYLKGLQAYLPLEAIQAQLQKSPHQIKQQASLSENEILEITQKLLASGLTKNYISDLLKTEIFINRKELLKNGFRHLATSQKGGWICLQVQKD